MENLHKWELTVAAWYKDMPHLSENVRQWIAKNIWWLTLIGVVLGAMGIFSVVSALLLGVAIGGLGGRLDVVVGGAMMLWSVLVTLLFAAANVVIAAVAIAPLKSLRKQGWSLLFLAALVNVASLVASFLFHPNILSLAYGLVFAAIGAYFLFEIRDLYHGAQPAKKGGVKAARKV